MSPFLCILCIPWAFPCPLMHLWFSSYGQLMTRSRRIEDVQLLINIRNVTKLMALIVQCMFQYNFDGHDCSRNAHLTWFSYPCFLASRSLVASYSYWLLLFWFLNICGGPHTNDPKRNKAHKNMWVTPGAVNWWHTLALYDSIGCLTHNQIIVSYDFWNSHQTTSLP